MIGLLDAMPAEQARGVIQTFKAAFAQGPAAEALTILRSHFSERTSMNTDPHQVAFLEGQRFVILTIDHLRAFDERRLAPAPTEALTDDEEPYA